MSVEIKNITKSFGTQKAVNNLSISFKAGEITGFLGPNGAGKSTTMKIITGLIAPDCGDVSVMGKDIKRETLEARKHIGYLPENNPLYTDMYVREYLEYVARIYMPRKEVKASVENSIQITGLSKEQHKKIQQLSKGYKQRVGLAQALLHDPDVLILDEPTTGLDPNQIGEIRDLIREVGKNKTVMLSTHIMQEVEALCDRVVIINDGKIISDDKVSNIVNNSSNTNISVHFTSQIDINRLKNLEFINNVNNCGNNKFIITAQKDIREDLFKFAVNNNYILTELNLLHENLESIFKKLTK